MDLEIRKIQYEDMTPVISILKNALSNFEPGVSAHKQIWSEFSSQPNVLGYVGIFNLQVIMYCSVFVETKIRGGKVGYIQDFAVLASHQKQGLGSEMLNFLTAELSEMGCYKISLSTLVENVEFYKKNGFTQLEFSMQKILN